MHCLLHASGYLFDQKAFVFTLPEHRTKNIHDLNYIKEK